MNRILNLEETVQFVLSPGSDSEMSELSDNNEENEIMKLEREHNQSMGGVDLADMLISPYRTKIIA